jgi:hypothetical protein
MVILLYGIYRFNQVGFQVPPNDPLDTLNECPTSGMLPNPRVSRRRPPAAAESGHLAAAAYAPVVRRARLEQPAVGVSTRGKHETT